MFGAVNLRKSASKKIPEHKFNHKQLMNTSKNSSDSGMILVATLILIGIITAMVIQMQTTARLALNSAERKLLNVQLRAAATDAAWHGLHILVSDKDMLVDHTNEPWAYPVEMTLPNGIETIVRITDENRLFDVNNLSAVPQEKTARLPSAIIRDLLVSCGEQNAALQIAKLISWFEMANKSMPATTARGFSSQSTEPSTGPSACLIESTAELARVLGASFSSAEIPEVLTIVPDRQARILPVNINTSGRTVLLGVFGPREHAVVDSLCRLRDSHPLISLAPLEKFTDEAVLKQSRCYFDVKSSVFSIQARAGKSGLFKEIYSLVNRNPKGEIEILRWICR